MLSVIDFTLTSSLIVRRLRDTLTVVIRDGRTYGWKEDSMVLLISWTSLVFHAAEVSDATSTDKGMNEYK